MTQYGEARVFNARLVISAMSLSLLPNLAFAHVNAGEMHGLIHGLTHPLLGLDHLLAMIAVGLWAAQLSGKATWLVPLSFISLMTVGGSLGFHAMHIPFAETGILVSLLVLGLLIAAAIRLPMIIG